MGEFTNLQKMTDELKAKSKGVISVIEAITDPLTFVECDRFLRSDTELGAAIGEGVVSGYASIDNIDVGLFAINGEVLKGSIGKKNSEKIVKLINNSIKTGSSVIGIFDTSGARFSEGIEALNGYSGIIKAFSDAYGEVPTIAVIKGNNLGLLSFLSGICDCCIGYEKSSMCSSSPLILSAKAGVDISKVGTAELHSKNTGLYSMVVKNDKELKASVTNILNSLCRDIITATDDGNRASKALKTGAAIETVISEIFDKGSFVSLKKDYGKEVVTGFARLNGISVGVVANNGAVDNGRLTSAGCIKIAELLNTCEAFGVSVVNLVDCGGVVQNIEEENGALIRETANLLYLYNQICVPKIALITGKAIGGGYVAFASKEVVDYSLAWENAEISAIDSKSAAELLYQDEIAKSKNKEAAAKKLAESYAEENNRAVSVSKDGYIDNIISPEFSRQYLIAALQTFVNKR